jgi:choline-glycine betaine transporter
MLTFLEHPLDAKISTANFTYVFGTERNIQRWLVYKYNYGLGIGSFLFRISAGKKSRNIIFLLVVLTSVRG